MSQRHIVLAGPMGVGKSTTAELLVDRLGWQLRDSDGDIERLFGRAGASIAAEHGVNELHRIEAAVLLGALASPASTVITAAASVIDDVRCREALARCGDVVVLDAPDEVLESRRTPDDHRRVVDMRAHRAVTARRRPMYAAVAVLQLDATRSPSMLVDAIVRLLAPTGS